MFIGLKAVVFGASEYFTIFPKIGVQGVDQNFQAASQNGVRRFLAVTL